MANSKQNRSRRSSEAPVERPSVPQNQDDETRVYQASSLESADYPVAEVETGPAYVAPLTNYGPSQTSLPAPDPTVRIKAPYRAEVEAEKWQAVRAYDPVQPEPEPEPTPSEQEQLIRQRIAAEDAERRRLEREAARQATRRVKRRTRWRQVVVLGTLFALLAGGGIFAALSLTGIIKLPGLAAESEAVLICPTASFVGSQPADIEANVYNASGISGLATKVSDEIAARGFKVKSTKNDPMNGSYPENAAVIRFGPNGLAAAWTALTMFPLAKLEYTKTKGNTEIIDIVLAPKYTAMVPLAEAMKLSQGPIPAYVDVPGCQKAK